MYVYHDKYDRRAQNNSINFGPTELSYIGEKGNSRNYRIIFSFWYAGYNILNHGDDSRLQNKSD